MNKIYLATFFICFASLAFFSCEKSTDTSHKQVEEEVRASSGGGSWQLFEGEGGSANFCAPSKLVTTTLPDGRVVIHEVPTECAFENPTDHDDIITDYHDNKDLADSVKKESIK